jgi:hypothetical protein
VIMTGKLSEHAPVSITLISDPEGGKTSIATAKKCKAIEVFTDVTGRGLIDVVRSNKECTHIVLNDLVAIMSHRATVNAYTQAVINAMTEEGLQAIAVPGQQISIENGKRGIIACQTYDLCRDGRAWWNKIGLNTRLLPFAYAHSAQLMLKIKAAIDNGSMRTKKKEKQQILWIPQRPVLVRFPDRYVEEVRKMADAKSGELGEVGYRRLKQFRSLACGHALRRSRKRPSVGEAEIEFLDRIFPYISYRKMTEL